jgi:glucose-1-phosphate thymidylyltransferase
MISVIIAAGGRGKRVEEIGLDVPKALLPVAGKPLLQFLLEMIDVRGAGIVDEVIVVTGYKSEMIDEFLTEFAAHRILSYRIVAEKQQFQTGNADAVLKASKHVHNKKVVVSWCDHMYDFDFHELSNDGVVFGVLCSADKAAKRFGVMEFSEQGRVLGISERHCKEKLGVISANLRIVSCGVYYFPVFEKLIDEIKKIEKFDIKSRGEFQISDAISYMIRNGNVFEVKDIQSFFDLGDSENVLNARRLLERWHR